MTNELQLNILTDMLNIETVNGMNKEINLAKYINLLFQSYKIESEIINIDGGLANVTGIIKGKDTERKIVFNGHLDTVPYGDIDSWKTDPKKAYQKHNKIFARGASDMKSGLAAMVCSFCMIAESNIVPEKTLIFIGTADEEKNGIGAQEVNKSNIVCGAEALIIGEPTNNKIGLAEKGCIWLECNFKGKTGHGAYPQKGINAIEVGYAFYEKLKQFVIKFQNHLLGSSTISLNKISGGNFPNMIADRCYCLLDIRFTLPLNLNLLLKQVGIIMEELNNHFGDISLEYKVLNHRRALELAKEAPIVESFASIVKEINYNEAQYTGINFFSDGSLIAENDFELPIFLFGPGDPELAHQPNEYVEINLYLESIVIFHNFMLN
jgi:succinyl-diaminopimelate desuccinylase